MLIPVVSWTRAQNTAYVKRQAETFLSGTNPPDFGKDRTGLPYVGLGVDGDVVEPVCPSLSRKYIVFQSCICHS